MIVDTVSSPNAPLDMGTAPEKTSTQKTSTQTKVNRFGIKYPYLSCLHAGVMPCLKSSADLQ